MKSGEVRRGISDDEGREREGGGRDVACERSDERSDGSCLVGRGEERWGVVWGEVR